MLLSIIKLPFQLLMNILTIINFLIFLSIFLAIYYLYVYREYVKYKILELIKNTNFNSLSRKFQRLAKDNED